MAIVPLETWPRVTGAGADGTPPDVTEFEDEEIELTPVELEAVTLKVYVVPPVIPLTVHEVDEVVHVKVPGDELTV